jgi:glc operon protein GlcG
MAGAEAEAKRTNWNGASVLEGGIPIVVDGKLIGGVGASGVASEQDAQIARAGVDSLK